MLSKILNEFSERPGEFISGGELSEKLQCSRTAIWKHIENLRKQGYEFEAVSRKGYRLIRSAAAYDVDRITAELQTKVMGKQLIVVDEIDSTQTKAHALVAEGAVEGTVVLAEHQTHGKGTRGRTFFSPSGKGIWFSIVLKPRIPLQFVSQLTLLTSVCLCRTISKTLGIAIGVKWPNDLLINGKKVSGILLESSAEDDRVSYVIAGVGISANLTIEDFPEEIREKATSLFIEGQQVVDREALFCAFLLEFEQLYELYLEQGFSPIRTLWEVLSVTLNRPVEIITPQGRIEGVAKHLDETGALNVLTNEGILKKVYSGDVFI